MIKFILNDVDISTDLHPGITILDYIRYTKHLTGTKIGCREGDCGACTILVGELRDDKLVYHSVTSCLMPLGNASGKHIVSIEGINFPDLNPVQSAMSDQGATQCGFCTPGFVMSLTGFCIQDRYNDAIAAVDGNICRCTGYKSIERAAHSIEKIISERKTAGPIEFAVNKKIVPEYFLTIKKRLEKLSVEIATATDGILKKENILVGGGTDLYVQKHEEMVHSNGVYVSDRKAFKGISKENNLCVLGPSTTVTDLMESKIIRDAFPEFLNFSKLISSTPIRNMATIGGNFVNASPIGDFTIFFIALESKIKLKSEKNEREIYLKDFYEGYKKLNRQPGEIIESISFELVLSDAEGLPEKNTYFNFEKVSKRTNLDIASVNSAIKIIVDGKKIVHAVISAGGVGPIPMVLHKTSDFLKNKSIDEKIIDEACQIVDQDISPIGDARGSEEYKRFLIKQLIRAHFIRLFPSIQPQKFQMAYEEH